jgi:acyl dehydratase
MTEIPENIELHVTPDPYVTVRYAGASGDFNPIHIDEQFALSVGLPGRILHGLWSMAQVARAVTEATGGPEHLQSLSASFRGMGSIGEEIVVTGKPVGTPEGGVTKLRLDAVQGSQRLVKGAAAEVRE